MYWSTRAYEPIGGADRYGIEMAVCGDKYGTEMAVCGDRSD